MANVSNTVAFKLVSQYDNTGVQLAMKDLESSQKMIAGMSEAARGPAVDSIAQRMADTNLQRIESEEAAWKKLLATKQAAMNASVPATNHTDFKQSLAEESANKQKSLDREVWAQRARLRDEDTRREAASAEARRKTDSILSQARILSAATESRAADQKRARLQSDAQVEAALERSRHDRVMQNIIQESGPAGGRGTAGGVSSAAARNLQQVGFMAQDFTSQFQNAKTAAEGFARGVSAISNNIQVMGAGLPPMQQAMFAIGGAAAGVIVPAVARWLDDSKALEEKTKAIEASHDRMGTLVKGLQSGNLLNAGPMNNAEKAKSSIDDLTNRITAASVTSNMLKKKIEEEMQTGGNATEIEAFRKHQAELTEEIRKAEMERAAIQEIWGRSKLEKALKAIEDEKKAKKAAELEEQDGEKALAAAINQMKEEARAEDDKIRRQYDVRQAELRNQIQDLQANAMTPNGSSAASVRGTSAATSAINRAISGSNSVEGDNRRKIKLLEDQLRALERLEQKMNFKRAGLSA